MHPTLAYIQNSGLILISPFLQRLFEQAGLIENNAFKNEQNRHSAVELLYYIVYNQMPKDNFGMELNKILCGMKPEEEIFPTHEIGENWTVLGEKIWNATINNWTSLGNISVTGLFDSFVKRSGRLEATENSSQLTIEAKTLDRLLQTLPWSVSEINHPWMDKPLYTSW